MMRAKGVIASNVNAGEKGVGMKIMCPDYGDTYRIYIPTDRLQGGEQHLNMLDKVILTFDNFYANGKEIGLNKPLVVLDNGKA